MIRTIARRLFGNPPSNFRAAPELVHADNSADPYVAQQHILRDLRKTAPVVFDIGAHKGLAAKTYRSLLPDAAIYCFEPFPDSVEALRRNLANEPAVTVVPKAVSDKTGSRTFFVNGFDATNSLLPRPKSSRRYFPRHAGPKTTIEVETTSLDEFVRREGIDEVSILKFDIQGGELMALKGATDLLRRGSVLMIYTEILFVHLYQDCPLFNELWTYLGQFGYQLYDIYNLHRAANGQLRYGDALFVCDQVRRDSIDRRQEEP